MKERTPEQLKGQILEHQEPEISMICICFIICIKIQSM